MKNICLRPFVCAMLNIFLWDFRGMRVRLHVLASVVFSSPNHNVCTLNSARTSTPVWNLLSRCYFLSLPLTEKKEEKKWNQNDVLLKFKKEFVSITIIKANIWWFHCVDLCWIFYVRFDLDFLYLRNMFDASNTDERCFTYYRRTVRQKTKQHTRHTHSVSFEENLKWCRCTAPAPAHSIYGIFHAKCKQSHT